MNVRIVEGQRGRNVTICLAISPQLGLLHSSIFEGGVTQDKFSDYLMELSEFMRIVDSNYVILRDNARSHLNAPNFS